MTTHVFQVAASGAASVSIEPELYEVDASAGPRTYTLPSAASCRGAHKTICKSDASANTVTIATTGGQAILGTDGSAATRVITAQHAALALVSNGTAWRIV